MAKFRLAIIAQLARQMGFAPQDVRAVQLARAEELLHLIDPAKAYPLDFVIYRITEYRPKQSGEELLTGLALQHDLGALIEQVSDGLNLHTRALAQPVLTIGDVCARFNVTSKTIQRWRRRGLPARRFIYPDGKRRVGFLLSSVERFLGAHRDQLPPTVNFTELDEPERQEIIRRSRLLAQDGRSTPTLISRRIARRLRRSPLTILHTIRKHDQENPADAILPLAAKEIDPADRLAIAKAHRRGAGIGELARRFGRPWVAIYSALLEGRISRLMRKRVRFNDDPLFHQEDAEAMIDAMLAQDELAPEASKEELRVPSELPPGLADLYRTPLLSRGRERALFLKYNLCKFRFITARRELDPETARARDLAMLENLLAGASQTKQAIVRANLRLAVSVARKHLRPNIGLMELLSDGSLILMRAVDGFDVNRGNRFSTYATLALMKGFARIVPQMLSHARKAICNDEMLESVPDVRPTMEGRRLVLRDEVRGLLSRLSEREQRVLAAHFGIDHDDGPASYEQVGQRLGLSKERVRQIEQIALAKLRAGTQTIA